MFTVTLDENGNFVSIKKFEEKQEWYVLSGIDDHQFIQKVENRKLTKLDFEKIEFTALTRAASHNSYIKEKLKEFMNLRPLPIKLQLSNKNITLKPHQLQAIKFMQERESIAGKIGTFGIRGGILDMKMGLMKTLISISHSLITPKITNYPTLIIASKIVMMEWKSQAFEKFFGDRVNVYYLHPDLSNCIFDNINVYDFVITTYDVVSRNFKNENDKFKLLYKIEWERIICDESHTFVNTETQLHKSVLALNGKYKWCLTGTPIRNASTDLWSQLKFCGYNFIKRKKEWEDNELEIMKTHNLEKAIYHSNYEKAGIVIPDKEDKIFKVSLQGIEKQCYDAVLKKVRVAYDEMTRGATKFANVLSLFTRLRLCCIAPYLITANAKRNTNKDSYSLLEEQLKKKCGEEFCGWIMDKDGTAGIKSSKITKALDILKRIPKGEKILVFSSFTSSLDLLAYAVKKNIKDFNIVQIDGDVKTSEKVTRLHTFKNDEKCRALFLTYKVGAQGLNLTEANHVLYLDIYWNNATHEQAEARTWRPGQDKKVYITSVHVENSIEDKMQEICSRKESIKQLLGLVIRK